MFVSFSNYKLNPANRKQQNDERMIYPIYVWSCIEILNLSLMLPFGLKNEECIDVSMFACWLSIGRFYLILEKYMPR